VTLISLGPFAGKKSRGTKGYLRTEPSFLVDLIKVHEGLDVIQRVLLEDEEIGRLAPGQ
jgi:hypothetical protein